MEDAIKKGLAAYNVSKIIVTLPATLGHGKNTYHGTQNVFIPGTMSVLELLEKILCINTDNLAEVISNEIEKELIVGQ